MTARQEPRLLDCRKRDRWMSSLSWTPNATTSGHAGTVAAHEGDKPNVGDYLALATSSPDSDACYVVEEVDHCWNVDPANMWIARVRFVPGADIRSGAVVLPDMEPRR